MKSSKGFMLVTTLAVLVLMSMLGLLIANTATSEIKQSGNSTGLARAREAAEAAQADAEFYLVNQGLLEIDGVLQPYVDDFMATNKDATTTPIISRWSYGDVLTSLNALAGDSIASSAGGADYDAIISFTRMSVDEGSFKPQGVIGGTSFQKQGQTYYLDYRVEAHGTVGRFVRTVTATGTLRVRLGRKYLNQYVLLAQDGGAGSNGRSGFFDSSMSFDGPVHFNKNLALSGKPQFLAGLTVSAGAVFMDPKCNYHFEKVSVQADGCTKPNFNGYGLQYGVDKVPLPTNSFSQQRAALGLSPTDPDNPGQAPKAPSKKEICNALGDAAHWGLAGRGDEDEDEHGHGHGHGHDYCHGNKTLDNGVYLPNRHGELTGGIYIQGDAKSLTLSVDAQGDQVYRIKDQTNQIYTITVNYTMNRTTLESDGESITYKGVPNGFGDPGKANGQIYVTGDILSLQGPERTGPIPDPAPSDTVPHQVPPAVASKSQLNIAASGKIEINGDLVYQDDPRSDAEAENVLGVIAGTGNVMIGTDAPDDIYIQAAILAANKNKGLGVVKYNKGAPRGHIHLLGSVAEYEDQVRGQASGGKPSSGYSDDWHYDQRFVNGGVVPPYFPATTTFAAQASWPLQRTWKEN
jgi:Tfp pilus assembly protein PilX